MADDQFRADFGSTTIAEIDHFLEVVAGVDVNQRKRQLRLAARAETDRLERQMQHDDRILTAREQQRGLAAFGDQLADDVDRLGFEPVEMVHPVRPPC